MVTCLDLLTLLSGLLKTQSLHETDEDAVADIDFTNIISEEEKEELKIELAKVMNLNFCEYYCFYFLRLEDVNCRIVVHITKERSSFLVKLF